MCLLAPTRSQLPVEADLRSQMTSQAIIIVPPRQLDPLRNKLNKIFQKKLNKLKKLVKIAKSGKISLDHPLIYRLQGVSGASARC